MPSGSGDGDERTGKREGGRRRPLFTPQMGKLRHGAAGRGAVKGFGALSPPKPRPILSPGRELAGCGRNRRTPVVLESFFPPRLPQPHPTAALALSSPR